MSTPMPIDVQPQEGSPLEANSSRIYPYPGFGLSPSILIDHYTGARISTQTCTGGGSCGSPDSIFPQSEGVYNAFSYSTGGEGPLLQPLPSWPAAFTGPYPWPSGTPISPTFWGPPTATKVQFITANPGPRYNTVNTSLSTWNDFEMYASGNPGAFETPGGTNSGTQSNPPMTFGPTNISTLDVGERMAGGTLTTTCIDTAHGVSTLITFTETSSCSLLMGMKVTPGATYVYRVYMAVSFDQWVMGTTTLIATGFPSSMTIGGVKAVSTGGGAFYADFTIVATGGYNRVIDVSPGGLGSSHYTYTYGGVDLISVTPPPAPPAPEQ